MTWVDHTQDTPQIEPRRPWQRRACDFQVQIQRTYVLVPVDPRKVGEQLLEPQMRNRNRNP